MRLPVLPSRDPVARLADTAEVYGDADPGAAQAEGARCMSCGSAFCMPTSGYGPGGQGGDPALAPGCPLGNLIPEWNKLVELGRWRDAWDRLVQTNPFPEFTSRVCPAPCQDACIQGINDEPIQIKGIERAITDHAFARGWPQQRAGDCVPGTPTQRAGDCVPGHVDAVDGSRTLTAAVVGSGPAGLAAADGLARRGWAVTVHERSDAAGGLLRYGIPGMKLGRDVLDRRLALLERLGVRFELRSDVTAADRDRLLDQHDAVLLCCGAQRPRLLDLPGADLRGVRRAMTFLSESQSVAGMERRDAAGRDVVVIGGGDTGADCIATALRQGCRSVVNITRRPQEPDGRDHARFPWPGPTGSYRLDYAHQEGLARDGADPRRYRIQPLGFVGDGSGRVSGVQIRDLANETDRVLPATRVYLAIGFTGSDTPAPDHITTPTVPTKPSTAEGGAGSAPSSPYATPTPRLYVAGDARRGSSLVVWALREGRDAAAAIHHAHLTPTPTPRRGSPRAAWPVPTGTHTQGSLPRKAR